MEADEPTRPTEGNEASPESVELTDEAFRALTSDLRDPADLQWERFDKPKLDLVNVLDLPTVMGKRVVVRGRSKHTGDVSTIANLRAVSEVFTDSSGAWVRVAEEWRWYRWASLPDDRRPPMCPRAVVRTVYNVWVDPTS